MSDEQKSAPPESVMSITSELWTGAGIILVACAMIIQAAFFTGDRLSTTAEALGRLW